VGLLAVVVAALSVLSLQHARPATAGETAAPVPTFTFGAAPTPTAEPTETAAPNPTAPAPLAAPGAAERLLSMGSDAWWRATAGACGADAPLVERSADGGQTWSDVTPGYRGLAQVRALAAFGGTQGELIGDLGDGCETQLLRTFTQGQFWETYPDLLVAATYLDAGGAVVSPAGSIPAPCSVPWGLRADGTTVALLCDGIAYRLDGGSWTALSDASAVALAVDAGGVLVAHADAACAGLAVTRYADAPVMIGCVDDAQPPVAIAASEGAVALWSADRVTVLGG